MSSFFIDTSALFKRYQPEQGTDIICQIVEDTTQPVFISSISIIEVISNLRRLFEIDKVTTEEQFLLQRSFFYKDATEFDIKILDVTSDDMVMAEGLILKRYMKPVDSIQLAVALNLGLNDLIFVSSDKRLNYIARSDGLLTLNPEYPKG